MKKQKITITNDLGLHARPATLLVQEASKYKSTIKLRKDETEVNAKSIMGILVLAASKGTELELIVDGEDEEEAKEAIVNLFESNFNED